MLSSQNRLRFPKSFPPGFPKKIFWSFGRMEYFSGEGVPQFLFIIPKRLEKRLSRRNQTKRFLSQVVQRLIPSLRPGLKARMIITKLLDQKDKDDSEILIKNKFKKEGLLRT